MTALEEIQKIWDMLQNNVLLKRYIVTKPIIIYKDDEGVEHNKAVAYRVDIYAKTILGKKGTHVATFSITTSPHLRRDYVVYDLIEPHVTKIIHNVLLEIRKKGFSYTIHNQIAMGK